MSIIKLSLTYIKEYKNRSLIIFLSFLFAVIIACTNGIMKHSANIMELNIQKQYNPYHIKIINARKNTIEALSKHQQIEETKVEKFLGASDDTDSYRINLLATADGLNDSTLLSGRVAKNTDEVAVEKWIADNLSKKIGDVITYTDFYTKKIEQKRLVGLLKDNDYSKNSGIINFITTAPEDLYSKNNILKIELKDSNHLRKDVDKLKTYIINELGYKESDVHIDKMLVEAYENDGNLIIELLQMLILSILFVGLIVFSTYFVSIRKRVEDMGILRALGIKRIDILSIIITELSIISLPSIVVGTFISIVSAKVMTNMGYNFYSETNISNASFADIKIPINIVLVVSVLILAVVVIISFSTYILSIRKMPINALRADNLSTKSNFKFFSVKTANGTRHKLLDKFGISKFLTLRYMQSDIVLLGIIIASMSVTTSEILHQGYIFETDKKIYNVITESSFGIGDITINKSNPHQKSNLIDDDFIKDLYTTDGIKGNFWTSYKYTRLKVPSAMMTNTAYFDETNKSDYVKEVWKGMYKLKDNTYTIKNKLLGFNDDSLKYLIKNRIQGKIDIDSLNKNDECILFYPKNYINLKEKHDKRNEILKYKVGDTIAVEIPVDFDISAEKGELLRKYWTLDYNPNIIRKEFKIVAIVDSTPFKVDYSVPSTDIIISQNQMLKIDKNEKYCLGAIKLKDKNSHNMVNNLLLSKFENNPGFLISDNIVASIKTQNFISNYINLENIKYFSFIVVCIFSFINIISYKVLDNKKDIAVLRALGITDRDIKNMLLYEGLVYTFMATILSWCIAFIRQIIYTNNLETISHITGLDVTFSITMYTVVFIFNLIVCTLSIYIPGKNILKENIRESIGGVE